MSWVQHEVNKIVAVAETENAGLVRSKITKLVEEVVKRAQKVVQDADETDDADDVSQAIKKAILG